MTRIEVETPTGPAWVDLDRPTRPVGVLMIGHGAGGSVDAPDLVAVRDAAVAAGVAVARVTQPYRVAGRRAPAPSARLDEAWLTVDSALRRRRGLAGLPFVFAGRSSGARVACRCAAGPDAPPVAGVVALAFPVHPPGRPERSRIEELTAVTVPMLVVQGDRDAFGCPPAEAFAPAGRRLVVIAGADHSLKKDPPAVAAAVATFLLGLLGAR